MDIVSPQFFDLIDTFKCRDIPFVHHLEELDTESLRRHYAEARAVCLAFHGYQKTTDKMLDIAKAIKDELEKPRRIAPMNRLTSGYHRLLYLQGELKIEVKLVIFPASTHAYFRWVGDAGKLEKQTFLNWMQNVPCGVRRQCAHRLPLSRRRRSKNMRRLKFATVCSGIGAPEQAWKPLGWQCSFASEIEKFPSEVHRLRHPGIPNLGDIYSIYVDTDAKVIYNTSDGQKVKRIPGGGESLQVWHVCSGCGGLLRSDPTGNVGLDEASRHEVQEQSKIRGRESLPSKRVKKQQTSNQNGGKGNKEWNNNSPLGLRGVRQKLCSCQWEAANRGASLRLQQTNGSDVAVPSVPFQVAPEKQGHSKAVSISDLDLLAAGFPCQDLSVAGKRKGLKHEDETPTRSGLFFRIVEIADAIGQRWTLLENVPGIFSSNEGRDFATVVGELAGATFDVPRDGWRTAGVAIGPKGLVEWVVLDAQWFGLAQRRKRVFIVRDSGDWANRPPLFLNGDRLSGNPPTRREAGQRTAATIGAGAPSRRNGGSSPTEGHFVAKALASSDGGIDREDRHTVIPIQEIGKRQSSNPMNGVGHGQPGDPMFTLQKTAEHGVCVPQISPPLRAGGNETGGDRPHGTDVDTCESLIPEIARSVAAERDGYNDGSDQTYIPEVARALQERDSKGTDSDTKDGRLLPVAFYSKGSGQEAGQLSPAIRATPHDTSHANGGSPPAIAFTIHGSREGTQSVATPTNIAGTVREATGSAIQNSSNTLVSGYAVRRLVPEECELLQGFPRYFTRIPWNGKPAEQCPDGPRYKCLGNAMACPVVRWIGRRILEVHDIK